MFVCSFPLQYLIGEVVFVKGKQKTRNNGESHINELLSMPITADRINNSWGGRHPPVNRFNSHNVHSACNIQNNFLRLATAMDCENCDRLQSVHDYFNIHHYDRWCGQGRLSNKLFCQHSEHLSFHA